MREIHDKNNSTSFGKLHILRCLVLRRVLISTSWAAFQNYDSDCAVLAFCAECFAVKFRFVIAVVRSNVMLSLPSVGVVTRRSLWHVDILYPFPSVAGHPVLNRRCTRLLGCIHSTKRNIFDYPTGHWYKHFNWTITFKDTTYIIALLCWKFR